MVVVHYPPIIDKCPDLELRNYAISTYAPGGNAQDQNDALNRVLDLIDSIEKEKFDHSREGRNQAWKDLFASSFTYLSCELAEEEQLHFPNLDEEEKSEERKRGREEEAKEKEGDEEDEEEGEDTRVSIVNALKRQRT